MGFISDLIDRFIKKTSESSPRKVDVTEIIKEAEKWIGVDETGPGVDVFRRAVNNNAAGEPWCVAFVMYCARAVGIRYGKEPDLYPTELAYELWRKSPPKCKLDGPVPGCIVVWNYIGTLRGHAGIVTSVAEDSICTIEGNTEGAPGKAHGVFRKTRSRAKITGSMAILGYLKAFS
jgi:uncharacterized protein (TIGR02594 family)